MLESREARLHAIFALLFVMSFWIAKEGRSLLGTWNDPSIGLLNLGVAATWVVSFFLHRFKDMRDQILVLRDRMERAERKLRVLEDENT